MGDIVGYRSEQFKTKCTCYSERASWKCVEHVFVYSRNMRWAIPSGETCRCSPHAARLDSDPPFTIFLPTLPGAHPVAIQPVITMYAVANIDSALWGTRSIGDVTNSATNPNTPNTKIVADMDDALPFTSSLGGGNDGSDGIKQEVGAFSHLHTGTAVDTSAVALVDEDEALLRRLKLGGSDNEGSSIGTLGTERSDSESDENSGEKGTEQGPGGKEGRGGDEKRGKLSLRAWKFVLLALWVFVNVGLTLSLLYWSLGALGSIFFFCQLPAQAFLVVAAWFEMRLQRRSALPPPPPFADGLAEGSVTDRNDSNGRVGCAAYGTFGDH